MKYITKVIPCRPGDKFRINHFTDVHEGAAGFDARLFEKFLKEQESNKSAFCIGTGDLIDEDRPSTRERRAAMYSDRSEAWTQEDRRSMAWLDRVVIPKYKRIASRCLGILDGDHFISMGGCKLTSGQYICNATGIPYLGTRMASVRLVFRCAERKQSYSYDILARHGTGSASTQGGDVTALVKQNAQWIADLYLGGHTHKQNIINFPRMRVNKEGTAARVSNVWMIRGGSFLLGYPEGRETYPERKEYSPLCVGWASVTLAAVRGEKTNRNMVITASRAELVSG